MALDLEALEEQMIADIMVDVPDDTSQDTIDIIEAGVKRNAKTIYDFIKTGIVITPNDGSGSQTLSIE